MGDGDFLYKDFNNNNDDDDDDDDDNDDDDDGDDYYYLPSADRHSTNWANR